MERVDALLAALAAYREDRADDPGLPAALDGVRAAFEEGLDDDLNVSEALAALFEGVRELNRRLDARALSTGDAARAAAFVRELDAVLGVAAPAAAGLDPDLQAMLDERAAARSARDWAASDRLRDELLCPWRGRRGHARWTALAPGGDDTCLTTDARATRTGRPGNPGRVVPADTTGPEGHRPPGQGSGPRPGDGHRSGGPGGPRDHQGPRDFRSRATPGPRDAVPGGPRDYQGPRDDRGAPRDDQGPRDDRRATAATAAARATSRARATRLVRGSGSATVPASSPVRAPRGDTALGVPVGGHRDRGPHATPAASRVRAAATGPVVPRVRRARVPPGRGRGRVDRRSPGAPGRGSVRRGPRRGTRARRPATGRTAARRRARSPVTGRTAARHRARSPVTGRTAARHRARSPRSPALPARPRSTRSPGPSAPHRVPGSRPARGPVARPPTAHARLGPGPARGARTRGTDRTTDVAPSR